MPELAEGARLEIVCSAYPGTVGSNPTLSAILFVLNMIQAVIRFRFSLSPETVSKFVTLTGFRISPREAELVRNDGVGEL